MGAWSRVPTIGRVGGKGKYIDSECIPYRESTRLALGLNMRWKNRTIKDVIFYQECGTICKMKNIKEGTSLSFYMSKFHSPN